MQIVHYMVSYTQAAASSLTSVHKVHGNARCASVWWFTPSWLGYRVTVGVLTLSRPASRKCYFTFECKSPIEEFSPVCRCSDSVIDVSVEQDAEPMTSRFAFDSVVRAVDYIWFSSVSLDVLGVLKVVDPKSIQPGVPNSVFPSDHVSLKTCLAFK